MHGRLVQKMEERQNVGKWIKNKYGVVMCSACREPAINYREGAIITKWQRTNYCPNCGEKMHFEERKEDEK